MIPRTDEYYPTRLTWRDAAPLFPAALLLLAGATTLAVTRQADGHVSGLWLGGVALAAGLATALGWLVAARRQPRGVACGVQGLTEIGWLGGRRSLAWADIERLEPTPEGLRVVSGHGSLCLTPRLLGWRRLVAEVERRAAGEVGDEPSGSVRAADIERWLGVAPGGERVHRPSRLDAGLAVLAAALWLGLYAPLLIGWFGESWQRWLGLLGGHTAGPPTWFVLEAAPVIGVQVLEEIALLVLLAAPVVVAARRLLRRTHIRARGTGVTLVTGRRRRWFGWHELRDVEAGDGSWRLTFGDTVLTLFDDTDGAGRRLAHAARNVLDAQRRGRPVSPTAAVQRRGLSLARRASQDETPRSLARVGGV